MMVQRLNMGIYLYKLVACTKFVKDRAHLLCTFYEEIMLILFHKSGLQGEIKAK